MKVCKTIRSARSCLATARADFKSIGFVPTMGALHAGHLSLVHKARKDNDFVVVSIFLNPIQFGENEDLSTYPRNFVADEKLLKDAGVDMVFYPSVDNMYSSFFSTYVNEEKISLTLCGAKRPGHFQGVTTVVAKLFNIIGPDNAYFGRKDYQQFQVIRRMVEDLNFPVKLYSCPIVREKDGLALSSRNAYLSPKERLEAVKISQSIKNAKKLVKTGQINTVKKLISSVEKDIAKIGVEHSIDYVEVLDSKTLENVKTIDAKLLLAVAVFVGKTRLIDNIII